MLLLRRNCKRVSADPKILARQSTERLEVASHLSVDLLDLIIGSSRFEDLPEVVQSLANGTLEALCHVVEYPSGNPAPSPATHNSENVR